MQDLFAKCGVNCGRCPSYRENLKTDADRQRCYEGWLKYLGIGIKPEDIYCDGSPTPDEEDPRLYYGRYGCTIRQCAVIRGVETCAHCSEYLCETMKWTPSAVDREGIEARLGAPIPEEDYLTFIEPYERLKHLDEIRASLSPDDIVEKAKLLSVKPRIADFPEDLPFSREETSAFKALYRLLATLKSISGETHSQQALLKKRGQYFLKLLWTFGHSGELEEEDGAHLVLDGEVYLDQKLGGQYSTVVNHFQMLHEFGVHCEVVPLGEGWLLPSGWLRRKGKRWDKGSLMKMSFDDTVGGTAALRALRSYAATLAEEYRERAFRYFSRVDMRVLTED